MLPCIHGQRVQADGQHHGAQQRAIAHAVQLAAVVQAGAEDQGAAAARTAQHGRHGQGVGRPTAAAAVGGQSSNS